MKKIVIILLVLLLVGFLYIRNDMKANQQTEQDKQPAQTSTSPISDDEIMLYLKSHIRALSPEAATLGGTFYVVQFTRTDIGKGVVAYEDGHMAYTADVAFGRDSHGAIQIDSFVNR